MIKKSFILVTMRDDYFSKINESRDCIDKRLNKWIIRLGFTPLLVPNLKTKNFFFEKCNLNISGIIISGGNNINKKSTRYLVEKKLLKYSIKKKLPVLGICHGMQMMSHYEGGSLIKIKNHVRKIHTLINKTKKYDLPRKVNSYHDYTIKKLSRNFNVISTCNKGSIEAISHLKYKWLGWMWHPERDKIFNIKLIKISKNFFKK
jgi:N5-(cytidine 5'-diphosphoramidyl)-L-glutamine hydrolase